jgi:hypothetical protein
VERGAGEGSRQDRGGAGVAAQVHRAPA